MLVPQWGKPFKHETNLTMNLSLRTLLGMGIVLEIILFGVSYALYPSWEEAFRYAARYSGRLSALVFLFAFYLFATSSIPVADHRPLRNWLTLFALLHVIHFGFLAANVYLNKVPLEAVKLAGGALAYLMIVAAPFFLHRITLPLQLVYFYYVSLVMILTWVARVKGEFQGAEPSVIHYVGIGVFVVCAILFGWWIRKRNLVVSP